ncbi:MAG TPA: PLP-dependent aminotransferase family protein [Polyangia bacterium]|jgi:2-aminoadipate transaminase
MTLRLATRAAATPPSAVREILKVAESPDVLSFAGGLPAPELFPVAAIAEAHARVLAEAGAAALQYSTTEGYGPLREWIVARLTLGGIATTVEQTLVTSGSQQGIDLCARALLDPGARVAVESPSYLAALQVFRAHGAQCVAVDGDADGIRIDELERLHAQAPLRLVYVVPNFQNPTGTTLSAARRLALVAFAQRRGVALLEDDPYGELRYAGAPVPPLQALDEAGVVVRLGSFSKTLAPGLRLAYATGPREVIRAMTVAKQAADLHTATLAQRAAAALLERFDYDAHLTTLRTAYGARLGAMLAALGRHLPAGSRWTRPEGGLFVWAELPGGLDAEALFPLALAQKVAFVPGQPFYAGDPRVSTLRLNFSNRPADLIEEGMARLGRVVRLALDARRHAA